MKKVLVIGSGGREHALGWKLGQSDKVSEVLYAPGNGGTEEEKGRNVSIDGSRKENSEAVYNLIRDENIDMAVVGPEQPLADGLVDYLNLRDYHRVIGPTQRASQLEVDKFFSFDLMNDLGIPQADSIKCYSTDEAIRAIRKMATSGGVVIKARWLTGGKGVTVCKSKEHAFSIIGNHAETYGQEVLIAKRLYGQEFSVFGISDGNIVSPLEISLQDHKQLFNGDRGPNTGGMGAYGPAPIASVEVVRRVNETIMTPVVQRMKEQGNEYKGVMYVGLIKSDKDPKVLEFNIRFGDPECQPTMMMLESDLYEIFSSSLDGNLGNVKMEFDPGAAVCVVLASKGYPGSYEKGLPIKGLDNANGIDGVKVFHAGTKIDTNGRILTSGGRVVGVTGSSEEGIGYAQKLAYRGVSEISIPGGFHYRDDIGDKALN